MADTVTVPVEYLSELEAAVATQKTTIKEMSADIALLREECNYLKRKLFGSKSETSRSLGFEQLSFFDEAEQECDKELVEEITYSRAKKRYKDERKIKLENLKHVKDIYDIDEKDRICYRCGRTMSRVGEEFVRSEIVYEPAKLYVKDIYRVTYECRKCRKDNKINMLKAGTPAPVIPHSYTSPSMIAQIVSDKYVNHMPLYRQEAEWKRLDLKLSRATMANWIIISANEYFIPLVNRMHELLLKETHLHSDETVVQVLNEPGKKNTSKSYMWVYASIRESEHPIRIFEYQPDRKSVHPEAFLKGFEGTLISDGYQGYNNIKGVKNAYCWAHCRRYFTDVTPKDIDDIQNTLVKTAIEKIGRIFAIEKKIDKEGPEEKVKIRREKSKPMVDDFFSWCEANQNKVLARSKLGKAFQYALNHEKGLRVFLDDGEVPLTNSLNERSIKPFTVSRKNWLFNGSPRGARASAATFSLVETAKANNLDAHDYIEYLLEMMPNEDIINHPEKLDDYLPWSKQTKSEFK